jgi:hypothetical protein
MNTDHLFYKLNAECTIIPKVLAFLPLAVWEWVPYQTVASNFPYHMINHDPFLRTIPKKFFPVLRLYKFPATSIYNWHRDSFIGCSLNMVLEDYNSFTLFNKQNEEPSIVDETIELKYEKQKWYLFNSQEMHLVANTGNVDRYLVSVSFPKIIQYKQVFDYFKQQESSAEHE